MTSTRVHPAKESSHLIESFRALAVGRTGTSHLMATYLQQRGSLYPTLYKQKALGISPSAFVMFSL